MKFVAAGLVVALSYLLLVTENHAGDKADFTISEVMAKAQKSGLFKKVASGKADDDEKKELVKLYTALSQNSPPKGDEKEWKKLTSDMVKAAKAVASGDEKAGKTLQKLGGNCAGCHGKFKG